MESQHNLTYHSYYKKIQNITLSFGYIDFHEIGGSLMFGFYKVYHVTVRTWRNKFHRVSLRYSIIQPTCNSKRQSKRLQRSKKYLKEISDTQFRYCQNCLHIKCKNYICQIDRYRIQTNDQKRTRVQTAIIWSIAKNVF